MKLSTKEMILAALFTALTAAGAKLNLLLPGIPITFQPIIVMFAGSLLGKRSAALSQVVYILLGLIGIPVFAKPIAGPAYILQPTFGYLIGFAAGAYLIGYVIEKWNKRTLPVFICANMTGLLVIYLFGVLHLFVLMNFFLGKNMTVSKAFINGMFQIFLIKDLVLGFAVSFIAHQLDGMLKHCMANNFNAIN